MANGIRTTLAAVLVLLGAAPTALALPNITTPPAGTVYHAVYPGGVTGEEDDLTPADVDAYEAEAGKPVAWVYFSQNWYRDRLFPAATATWIQARGAVPYIRMMIRSIPFKARNRRPFRLRSTTLDDAASVLQTSPVIVP